MAVSSCDGERRRSRVEEEIGEGGGRSRAGGKEMDVAAARRLQDARRGHEEAWKPSAATWRAQLARWHSTEQLGGAGRGRRLPCPFGPAGLGWADFAWATGKSFSFSFYLIFPFFSAILF